MFRFLVVSVVAPAAVLVAFARPAALPVLLLIALLVAGLSLVGSWLLGEQDPGDADRRAVRAAARSFAVAVVVAALVIVLGPASVPVLAVLAVATTAVIATRIRPAHPLLGPEGPQS